MISETRTLPTADGDLGIHVAHPDGPGPFPAVLFFHHGPGFDAGSREAAERIAAAGHLVVAPDRYHREGPWMVFDVEDIVTNGPDSPVMAQLMGVLLGTTEEMVASDVAAVLAMLADEPLAGDGPMGAIGYCVGARSVLATLADHPGRFGAGVMLHPSFCVTDGGDSPHLTVASSGAAMFVGVGHDDGLAPVDQNQPLLDAVAALGEPSGYAVYGGADHGFAVPGFTYHAASADRAYASALALFADRLG